MAALTELIAFTLTRDQLINILTQSGQARILIERHTTNTLRRAVIDLIRATGTDDTSD